MHRKRNRNRSNTKSLTLPEGLGKVAARLIAMVGAGVVAGLGGDPVAEPLGLAVTVERVA